MEVSEPIRTVDAPVVAQLGRAPIMAYKPTGETVQLAEVVTPPPAEELTAAPATLPETASSLPLLGLVGLLLSGCAVSLRWFAGRDVR